MSEAVTLEAEILEAEILEAETLAVPGPVVPAQHFGCRLQRAGSTSCPSAVSCAWLFAECSLLLLDTPVEYSSKLYTIHDGSLRA